MSSSSNIKVIVGLSGGVDSSVAAWQLQNQSYHVEALFMKNWEDENDGEYCSYADDLRDVKQICQTLDIPLHTVNFAEEYWQNVFSLFLEEYQKGHTPNPDILCNKEIKFKVFLEHALKLGADKIATGHYAQLEHNEDYLLTRARDLNKDQTYFLYTLNQTQLSHSLFPIGHLEKPALREIAKNLNLVTHNKKDSTGICFIGERRFKNFLKEYLPAQPGPIQDDSGKTIGQHDGLMYYTLGQRQGLGIGGLKQANDKPWYVALKNLKNNTLTVVQGHDHPLLHQSELLANSVTWIKGSAPSASFKATAKIRYRQTDASCTVHLNDKIDKNNETAHVVFDDPQWAVTPGQSIVFYQGDVCLGGAVIQEGSRG